MVAYAEFVEFIAAGVTPQQIVNFRPSKASENRLSELMTRSKNGTINVDEQRELDHFKEIEHIMRMAKARAWKHVEGQ